jgi:EAL domain-containing protein (putative c-di-GMP-specific phosphodiesterase class I)
MLASEMADEATVQKEIADKLVSALKQGGFVLYAQKIVPLKAGDDGPFREILVRFREEEEKLLPPGTFFPMLEEYHLLPYVDRWVVSSVAKWAQGARPGQPAGCNSINLSSDTMRDAKFGDYVQKHIETSKLPAGTLAFEFGWDMALPRADQLKRLQVQLKPLGCRFTLAGFDGGEASFGFLKSIAPDFVKLGYSIVKDIERGLAGLERAESISQKCHSMGIKTIAEYVESREVLEQLKLIEVDFAQGLAISPPQHLE